MEDILTKIVPFLETASYILMSIVVAASIIAKLTPTPKDDKIVSKFSSLVLKAIKFLPTIGVNPNTKKLEEAYKNLKDDEADKSN